MVKKHSQTPDLSYRTLFTALPESYIILAADDPNFTIVDVNPAHAKLTMRRPKDIVGMPMLDAFPDVSEKYLKTGVSDVIQSLRQVVRTGKSHNMRVLRYDITAPGGEFVERYWRPEHHPILDDKGNVAFILQTAQDITDEIKNDQRIRQIEHQLNDALAIGKVGSWQWDVQADLVVGDKNLALIFGIDPGESLQGVPLNAFISSIHPDDRDRVFQHIQKTLKSGKAFSDEYRTFGADGQIHWVIARGQVDYDAEGRPNTYPGVVVDITERKRAEEEVKRQSGFIETITRSIGDGVYATDRNGIVTFVNDAAQRMLGYRSRELIGQNIHELAHTTQNGRLTRRPKRCTILANTLKGKTTVSEDHMLGKAGNVFPVSFTSAPIYGPDGTIEGGVFAFNDITEQQLTQEKLRYQSLVVGSINDAIITIDLAHTITGWNAGAADLFGYTAEQAVGKQTLEILPMKTESLRKRMYRHALKHGSWRGDVKYYTHDRTTTLTVMVSVSALRDAQGKPIGLVMVMQDLSEINRAHAEADAAKMRARVSREQAASLKAQNAELVALNRTKDEFIALASHQLRTPATGVKQYLGMVLQGFAEPLSPGQENFLERAYECNERQLRIVEDILRVAQVDLDKVQLHPQPTDIVELLQDIIDNYQGALNSRHQKLIFHLPDERPILEVDRDRLRMAIDNIVDNAIKYTPERRSISIDIAVTPTHTCLISITDHGVGIRHADISRLFQKFSRLDNPLSVEVGGNGLGLYWSKKIINLHGGDITVTSRLNRGSTFTVSLPMPSVVTVLPSLLETAY